MSSLSVSERSNQSLCLTGLNQNAKLVVVAQKVSARGDISTSLKFANDLHERLNIDVNRILIASTDSEEVQLFNHHHFTVISPSYGEKDYYSTSEQEENSTPKIIQHIALQIVIPCDNSGTALPYLIKGIPILAIVEYDQDIFPIPPSLSNLLQFKSLGLSKDYLGIFIDAELRKWGFTDQGLISDNCLMPLKRLAKIKNLNDELQKSILGDLYSEEQAVSFMQSNQLNFAYAHSFQLVKDFVQAIIKLSESTQQNYTFVIPGKKFESDNRWMRENFRFIRDLMDAGIDELKITVFESDVEQKTSTISLKSSDTPKVLHILQGSFLNRTIKNVLMSAEREVLVTGDQTLSEAISANKNFIYEEQMHKKVLSSNIEKKYDELGQRSISEQGTYVEYVVKCLLSGIKNPHKLSAINHSICLEHDYLPNTVSAMNQLLSSYNGKCLIQLDKNQKMTPDVLPFDTPFIITLNQISSLSIRMKDSQSNLECFKDSEFQTESLLNGLYVVVRLPLKKVEIQEKDESKKQSLNL